MNWGAWNTNKCSKANCCCCDGDSGDSCTLPTATVTTVEGTCEAPLCVLVNDDAQIILSDIVNSDFGNYSLGTTYTGPAYGDPSNFVTFDGVESIIDLIHSTDYTIRLWNQEDGCYKDITVATPTKICPDPCCLAGTITFDIDLSFNCNTPTVVDIIFSNIVGGTPPYEYSIDGGTTWYPDTGTPGEETISGVPLEGIVAVVRDTGGCATLTSQPIYLPPEYNPINWNSYVGDPDFTGRNENVALYFCLGNGDYRIRGTEFDPAWFELGELYRDLIPFIDGETYQVDISMTASITPPGGCPRIWVIQNYGLPSQTTVFDTTNPADEPTGCAIAPNVYSFTFNYSAGDEVRIGFGQVGGGHQISNFTLIQFNIFKL